MWKPQQGDEDIVDDDVGVVGVGVDDDNSDTSHPEQPVGEDEGVDGVAGLAVPHLQYLCQCINFYVRPSSSTGSVKFSLTTLLLVRFSYITLTSTFTLFDESNLRK